MRYRVPALLAAAWAIVFSAPHLYWATGRTDGLGTALSERVVRDAGTAMRLGNAGIAVFCLCGAATALATLRAWPMPRLARGLLIGLTVFGAVLLTARVADIYLEFNLILTGVWHLPASGHEDFPHLARWFMFLWLPWFLLGAVAWSRLAWTFARSRRSAA